MGFLAREENPRWLAVTTGILFSTWAVSLEVCQYQRPRVLNAYQCHGGFESLALGGLNGLPTIVPGNNMDLGPPAS